MCTHVGVNVRCLRAATRLHLHLTTLQYSYFCIISYNLAVKTVYLQDGGSECSCGRQRALADRDTAHQVLCHA